MVFLSLPFLRAACARETERQRARQRGEIWKYSNYLLASKCDALGRMWEFEQQESNHLIKSWTSLQFNSIYKIYCLESTWMRSHIHKFMAVQKRSDTLAHISIVAFFVVHSFVHLFVCWFLLSRFFHRSTHTSNMAHKLRTGFSSVKIVGFSVVVVIDVGVIHRFCVLRQLISIWLN